MSLAEVSMNQGIDLKKVLYERVNSIPEDILNAEDRKARKRQIKKMLERIEETPKSQYDLSELLASAQTKE